MPSPKIEDEPPKADGQNDSNDPAPTETEKTADGDNTEAPKDAAIDEVRAEDTPPEVKEEEPSADAPTDAGSKDAEPAEEDTPTPKETPVKEESEGTSTLTKEEEGNADTATELAENESPSRIIAKAEVTDETVPAPSQPSQPSPSTTAPKPPATDTGAAISTSTSAAAATKRKYNRDPNRKKRPYNIKNPNRPKRPLSAYNLFFRDERDRLVREQLMEMDDSLPIEELVNCREKTRTGKRVHRKTHGAIGFAELGKMISTNWKNLEPDKKAVYVEKASHEKERYRREVKIADEYLKAHPPPDPMSTKKNGKRSDASKGEGSSGSPGGKRAKTTENGGMGSTGGGPTYPHGYFEGQYPPPYYMGTPMHHRTPYYDYYGSSNGYVPPAFMPPHPNGGHGGENPIEQGGGPPHGGPPPPSPYGYYPPPHDYYRYGPPPPHSGYGPPPPSNDGPGGTSNQTAQAFEPPPYHQMRPPQYDNYGPPPSYPRPHGESPKNGNYDPWAPPPPLPNQYQQPPPPPPEQQDGASHKYAYQCEVCNEATFSSFQECADHERTCVKNRNGASGGPPPPHHHQQQQQQQPYHPSMYPQQYSREDVPGGKSKPSPSPKSKQKITEKAAVEAVLALKG